MAPNSTHIDFFEAGNDRQTLLGSIWTFIQHHPSVLLGGFLAVYLAQAIYNVRFHPLSKIPGPFSASFSKSWINICYFGGTWHDDAIRIHRKYGPVVRIAPNEVSFVDVDALKTLYGYGNGIVKTPWYQTWFIPNMQISFFATQDLNMHKMLRGRVSAAYTMSSVLAMEPFIQEIADKVWSKFRSLESMGQSVNLSTWASYYTFDVVSQLALGGELGFVEKEEDVDHTISSIHDGFYFMSNMGHIPGQMWWMNNSVSQWLLENFRTQKLKAFNVFLRWLDQRCAERIEHGLGDRRKDMMQHFIEMKGGPPITKGDVMIEGVNILGAGADTTSIAILAILGDLVKHPGVVPRLQKEIDEAYETLKLGNGNEITYNDAAKLPFLAAVIKESMRLHPSIQYQLPRVIPAEGLQIGQYHLPKGVHAGISPRSMNRSQKVFGDDANDFVPSRWIPKNEKEEPSIKEMNRLLTTFGMGSRSCVGMNIALVNTHKFVAQFVRYFEFELLNKEKPWKTKTQWFSFQHNFWVKLKTRQLK